MIHVYEVLDGKGTAVQTVAPGASVLEAARLMNTHRIGAVVVMEGDSVAGILTERDVMTKVVAEAKAPAHTTVGSVMTSPVLMCSPDSKLSEARAIMRERRVRHLPVADGSKLAGIVSIGDLNLADNATLTEAIQQMETYISGDPM
ncbi:MAG: inosine-5-monophosphate dehydrogenase [Phycisphaeraceae bacterium]|nr:MAG: inosine-5-monophosphate dehydrogenase [Phycisphaeraceae bacterium]